MGNKRDKNKELNLGLAELLSNATPSEDLTPKGGENRGVIETEIFTVNEDLALLNAEFVQLAEAKQWGILVSRAERSLSSREDLESRLWWIRGQLGAVSLPVSLLAAPFESVCRELVGDTRIGQLSKLLASVGEIIIGRLRDVGDERQERMVRAVLNDLGIFVNNSALEGNFIGRPGGKSSNRDIDRSFQLGDVGSLEKREVKALYKRSSSIRSIFIAATASLVVLFLCILLLYQRYLLVPQLLTSNEGLVSEAFLTELRPPVIAARAVSSNLGALYYSIDRLEPQPNTEQQRAPAVLDSQKGETQTVPPSNKPASATESSDDKLSGGPVQVGASRPKIAGRPPEPITGGAYRKDGELEEVRTDGPLEGRDFKEGVERSAAPRPRLPSEPTLSGSESYRAPVSSYPDGSLNIGGEIRSALVTAEVFDRPSYHARVVARLMPGDRVRVEGRVGEWLRIRSRRGRAGFVYAQDIGDIDEFSVSGEAQNEGSWNR
jgi:hypothetical protein